MNKKIIALMLATAALVIPPSAYAQEEYSGSFVDADWIHKTKGTATITIADEKTTLSFESFETTFGPDLYVYLATDDKASEFVSLGLLQSNTGDQIYEIPADVNLSKYDKVLIWCQAFSVLFGSAQLA